MTQAEKQKLDQTDHEHHPDISCDAVWEMEDRGENPTILDIREQEEWDAGHIDYATHVPFSELDEKVEQLLPEKEEQQSFISAQNIPVSSTISSVNGIHKHLIGIVVVISGGF